MSKLSDVKTFDTRRIGNQNQRCKQKDGANSSQTFHEIEHCNHTIKKGGDKINMLHFQAKNNDDIDYQVLLTGDDIWMTQPPHDTDFSKNTLC